MFEIVIGLIVILFTIYIFAKFEESSKNRKYIIEQRINVFRNSLFDFEKEFDYRRIGGMPEYKGIRSVIFSIDINDSKCIEFFDEKSDIWAESGYIDEENVGMIKKFKYFRVYPFNWDGPPPTNYVQTPEQLLWRGDPFLYSNG